MKFKLSKIKQKLAGQKTETVPSRYKNTDIPFPALTPEERLYFDINGYLILDDIFSDDEIAKYISIFTRMWDEIMPLQQSLIASNSEHNLRKKGPGGVLVHTAVDNQFLGLVRVEHYDPYLSSFFCHPKILGVVEELTGSNVRLSATNSIINKPDKNSNITYKYDELHKANNGEYKNFYQNGLYHGSLVRAMLTLKDLNENSGGTICVPGTHKLDFDAQVISQIVKNNDEMITSWTGKAGSVFFFTEDLVHGIGINRSNETRMILGAKYAPTRFQRWLNEYVETESEINQWPADFRPLLTGEEGYGKYGIQSVVKNRELLPQTKS